MATAPTSTVKDEACFGIYTDCEALPDADTLADCLDASLDELMALPDWQRRSRFASPTAVT